MTTSVIVILGSVCSAVSLQGLYQQQQQCGQEVSLSSEFAAVLQSTRQAAVAHRKKSCFETFGPTRLTCIELLFIRWAAAAVAGVTHGIVAGPRRD